MRWLSLHIHELEQKENQQKRNDGVALSWQKTLFSLRMTYPALPWLGEKNEELKFWLRCRSDSRKGLKT